MYYSKDKRGIYILRAMEDISLNGDAYTTIEALFRVCQRNDRRLSYSAFREDLAFLLHKGLLHLEGQRLYTTYNWRCEQSAVISLANILRAPSRNCQTHYWSTAFSWPESNAPPWSWHCPAVCLLSWAAQVLGRLPWSRRSWTTVHLKTDGSFAVLLVKRRKI